MTTGSKVVCIDGSFPGPLRKLYTAVPVKGETYTIRSVYSARRIAFPSSPGSSDGEIGVLLNEIVNPPDPKNKYGQELGFKAERFREIEELEATNEKVEELEAV
ncbi:MAG: hypothetical protein JWQ71_570 [Pedosphaera sp.]|nr:hypothetical protein [Pedosphaera sp.]